MSCYSLPILILNLGGEMFYVLDQRLKAQKIPSERAYKVLNDIASVMFNEIFLEEIFKPQKLYNKHELYVFFKQVVHASIMKLNDNSMGKLYDLMIMVFKYQIHFVSRPRDILLVTLNHLDSLRNLVSSAFVHKQLDVVYHRLTKIYYPMRDAELQMIRYDLLNYLQDIHIKVSIFLRLGQQNNDGTFVNPTNESVSPGLEAPGIIRIFTLDQSIKDIAVFPPGGAYTTVDIQGSFDFKGNRGTTLGLSIYHDKTIQDDTWTYSRNSKELQISKNPTELVYRSEMNTLMNQLVGCRCEESEAEIIFLDLCSNIGLEGECNKTASNIQTVTLEELSVRQKNVLESTAEEVNVSFAQQNQEDLLYLLENTE